MNGILLTQGNREATRAGLKTMTRRLIRPNTGTPPIERVQDRGSSIVDIRNRYWSTPGGWVQPRYRPGQTVFIREPWCAGRGWDDDSPREIVKSNTIDLLGGDIHYLDEGPRPNEYFGRTRSPLHLPAALARDFVKILHVRAERLHDISDADCMAEGIALRGLVYTYPGSGIVGWLTPQEAYAAQMRELHGPEIVDMDPWLWVYEYELLERAERR